MNVMSAPANFPLHSLETTSPDLSSTSSNSSFLQNLGSELVYTQDALGQYLSFYWQNAQSYGLKLEQIVGSSCFDTFGPADKDAYGEQIRRVLERRIPETGNYSFGDKEGEYFLFELIISPILQPDGTASAVLVMGCSRKTERTEWTQQPSIHASQKLLTPIARSIRRTLDLDTIWQQTVQGLGEALEVSRCIICSYKPDNQKVRVEAEYCQPQFRSMLGRQLELETEPELAQAISTLQPVALERTAPNPLQQQSVLVVATSYQDQPNGLIVIQQCDKRRAWTSAEIDAVRDLAEQVGTAIAHATLYKELESAREEAEEASRLKSQFLANTSHELRTPLNGIIGFLKLILEGMADDPEEQREFIREAHNSGLHLLNIINDILDIAKIEAGKMELEFGQVVVDELFRDVEDFVRPLVQQKNLSFSFEMPATHDGVVLYGNYQRLLQVMLNLVGNAIKFTHEGGVTISVEIIRKKIHFNGQELPGVAKICVADTGIGVSLDKQDKLFQLFCQVDGSRMRQYGGTGLGLTISQRLVETMGGVVNFYSMGEGLGSTVTFTVPLFQTPVMIANQQQV